MNRASLVFAGVAFGVTAALAGEMPQIVVEASAPVHTERTKEGMPGGAQVDLLSVKYHVHIAGLDLTKHADVMTLEQQIKVAAQKACAAIKDQYPLRSMTDDKTCIDDATNRAMVQEKLLVADAEKRARL
jgi:UrcA family protein